jgi:hypothetical protein
MTLSSKAFEPAGSSMTITPVGGSAYTLNWITITPPGWDGGDPIDITNLSNVRFKTKMAPTLIEIGAMSFTAELDLSTINSAPINQEAVIVLTIPGWGTWTLHGYLRSIKPDELKIGDRATCSGELEITNTAISGSGSSRTVTEVGPSWASA